MVKWKNGKVDKLLIEIGKLNSLLSNNIRSKQVRNASANFLNFLVELFENHNFHGNFRFSTAANVNLKRGMASVVTSNSVMVRIKSF